MAKCSFMVTDHREMSEGPRQFGLGLGVVIYTMKDIIRPGRFQHGNPCMYLKENPTGPWTGFSTIRKSRPMGTWPRAKPLLGHACLELSRGRAAWSNWNLDSWLDPISVPGFAEVLWGLERILVTSGNGKFLFWAGRKPDVECATDCQCWSQFTWGWLLADAWANQSQLAVWF